MSLREELENVLAMGHRPIGYGDTVVAEYRTAAVNLILDHGQALLEALDLSDAAKWLTDNVGCNLISDDDGRWAVSTSGFQPVPEDGGFTGTVTITSFVDPEEWQPSVRQAIDTARSKTVDGGGA